jgi:predicted membrane channel-forming protein YqfA (hemolysin III family)
METQKLEKSLRQMRGLFIFLMVLQIIGILFNVFFMLVENTNPITVLFGIAIGVLFVLLYKNAAQGTQERTKKGYNALKSASTFILLGFPILTIFGIIYLNKLSKPEMKALFGVETANG